MSDEDAAAAGESSLDFILSTIPAAFEINPYLSLLKHDACARGGRHAGAEPARRRRFRPRLDDSSTLAKSSAGGMGRSQSCSALSPAARPAPLCGPGS
jgi:hypothetical protein